MIATETVPVTDDLRPAPAPEPLTVHIRRVDRSLPLPRYESAGAVGFDLASRVAADIAPGDLARIPANVIVEVPPGYALLVTSRSSTPARWGLLVPHGIGVIDQDYCGPDDEISHPALELSLRAGACAARHPTGAGSARRDCSRALARS